MFQKKDIEALRMLFSSHNYVMATAKSGKVIITGRKITGKAKLLLSIGGFPMQCLVWRQPCFIVDIVTEILPISH